MMVIVGGGLVGSLLGIYLARRGFDVEIFEGRAHPLRTKVDPTRPSINLTLCTRGLAALDQVGLAAPVLAHAVPAYGRRIHALDGSVAFQPYGEHGEALYSISRQALNAVIVAHAEREPRVRIHFDSKCIALDVDSGEVTFCHGPSGRARTVRAERVFGADGAFSRVRQHLQCTSRFNYSQQYWTQGYRELTIPARADGSYALAPDALHLWPRQDHMLIAFANHDRSFTCALHLPFIGERSHATTDSDAALLALLRASFPDIADELAPRTAEYFARPPNPMMTVRCDPWSYRDRVLLLGDAAHALLPYYGQGANAGFEDCAVLDRCIERHDDDWQTIFAEFEALRRPNLDVMSTLCMEHYSELGDRVGDPRFLLRKQVENALHSMFPDRYASLYRMISFTQTPYADAVRIAGAQRTIVDRILTDGVAHRLHDPSIAPVLATYLDAAIPEHS